MMQFIAKLTNKYYEDCHCQHCDKQINYVFEVEKSNKLCRTCAAKMIANSDGNSWEDMGRTKQWAWERSLIETSFRPDPLIDGDIDTNKERFPILKTIEEMQDQHPEIRRVLSIAKHKQLSPSHITNLKWALNHLELFNDPSWRIEMQKKIWLLAHTGTVYNRYYNSLQKFLVHRQFLTEKQLSSINKNYKKFRRRIAKLCLKHPITFDVNPLGQLIVRGGYVRWR